MSAQVIFIAGSPSPKSRSSFVLHRVWAELASAGIPTSTFLLRDFEPADVLLGKPEAKTVIPLIEAAKSASGIVLATPVYKGTYAGALKAVVDLIPPDSLVGKPALGIATTRLEAHAGEVDRAYRALFAFFRAKAHPSLVALDSEVTADEQGGSLAPAAEERVVAAARALRDALTAVA
jgi:FMN reductase